MATRYLVSDVVESLTFYRDVLGFEVLEQWGPNFAIVQLAGDVLWLSGPATSAAKPMPNGDQPLPGGWNRIVVASTDFDVQVGRLVAAGVSFRNEPISGPGGRQVVFNDPSGNPIELFESRG